MTASTGWNPRRYAEAGGYLCLFLVWGLLLQFAAHAYGNDFGGNPDEPAHFVTGMFVRDWLVSRDYLHPIAFAESWYLHYPKLGIGQWPPLLYLILGGWFLAFGVSHASALAFQLLIAAMTATVVCLIGGRLVSRWAGALAGLLFLASPLVQEATGRMVTEHLATLLALLSILAFCRFARTMMLRDGMLFGILSAAAILTRGSSWALGMVPGVVILFAWRFDLLFRAGLWLAALPVVVTCVPWYALTLGMTRGTWSGSTDGRPYWLSASDDFFHAIVYGVGLPILLLATIGLWARVLRPFGRRRNSSVTDSPVWAALFGFAAATWVLLCAVPTGSPWQFMTSLIPVVILFGVAGLDFLLSWLPPVAARGAPLFYLMVGAVFMVTTFRVPDILSFSGFSQVVDAMASVPRANPPVILLASDSNGEGAMVGAIAIAETRPWSYALRGSKVLVDEDWLQRASHEREGSVAEMQGLLDRIPVGVVIIDDSFPPEARRPYHDLLTQAVTVAGTDWQALSPLSVVRTGVLHENALRVFVRRPGVGPTASIDTKLIRSLTFTGRAGGSTH